jgi:predicted Zn finger-like uncharacterized protein
MYFGMNVGMSGSDIFRLTSTRVTLKCPECRASNEVTLDQVKQGKAITCAKCNKTISLIDKDKNVDQTVTGLFKSIDDLKRSLGNTGPST